MKNRDPLENADISTVPLEFSCPISNGMKVDPQEIEVQIKDKYEEISNQEFTSENNKQKYTMEKLQITASIHEGKKVFKCNICGKTYCKKQTVNEHIASVHSNVKFVTTALLER